MLTEKNQVGHRIWVKEARSVLIGYSFDISEKLYVVGRGLEEVGFKRDGDSFELSINGNLIKLIREGEVFDVYVFNGGKGVKDVLVVADWVDIWGRIRSMWDRLG
jgi:hypothetical protein